MFKQARRVFDRDELEDLGRRMAERRVSAGSRARASRCPPGGSARRPGRSQPARSPSAVPAKMGRPCGRSTGSTGRSTSSTRRACPTSWSCCASRSSTELIDAIARLAVRGAPALGVAGGFGVALLAAAPPGRRACRASRRAAPARARPTAVNLAWGVDRALACLPDGRDAVLSEALRIRDEDIAACAAMATRGADLIAELVARPTRARDDDLQHRRAGGRGARDGAGRDRRAPCPRRARGGAAARDPAAAAGRPAHGLGAGPDGGAVPAAGRRRGGIRARAAAARTSCSSARTGSPATGTPPTRSAACRWRSRRVMPACRCWWSRRRRRSTRRPPRATGSRSRNAATAEVTSYRGVRSAPAGTRALNPAFDVTPAGADHGDRHRPPGRAPRPGRDAGLTPALSSAG